MKRRNFFLLSLAGLATVAVPSYCVWKKSNKKKNPLYEPRILTTILEPSDIVEMGKMYCNQFPDNGLEEKLQGFLTENINKDTSDLASILEQEVKKDYETGNTVVLDGWILSETEAVQCALFSISESNLI
ncbi:hypothetical protein SB49_12200 [Sediminicola sp. YIK13]|uniref:hypothetical protein n=1 Tax=Sediminicola sp. YIK13 TaxID=1453352 RepID=UPI000722E884|nr:hypothetical protein [Sediminicola sp. YIK13]ALM08487.1 hypothetical protein SB49_12200 [Sediminicola sp. YIK13]